MNATLADIRVVDAGGPHELATVELLHRERLLERFGVRVHRTWVTNGADAAELLLAGEADAAIQIGCGPAIAAIAAGAPLRLVAGANLRTVHAIYSRDPDLRCIEDLRGRSMGVGRPGALIHQLAYAALRKRGVNPAEVRFVTIGNSAAVFRALLAGEVDAGFGETEVFEHQERYGVHALDGGVLWRELPDFPNQGSFATRSAIGQLRPQIVAVLAAHAMLYRRLQSPASWDAFADAWSAALPCTTAAEAASQWRFYQQMRPFAEDLRLPAEQIDFLQDLNLAMGVQAQRAEAAEIFDASLAREALDLIDSHGSMQ